MQEISPLTKAELYKREGKSVAQDLAGSRIVVVSPFIKYNQLLNKKIQTYFKGAGVDIASRLEKFEDANEFVSKRESLHQDKPLLVLDFTTIVQGNSLVIPFESYGIWTKKHKIKRFKLAKSVYDTILGGYVSKQYLSGLDKTVHILEAPLEVIINRDVSAEAHKKSISDDLSILSRLIRDSKRAEIELDKLKFFTLAPEDRPSFRASYNAGGTYSHKD